MFKKCLLLLLTTGTCFAANSGEYATPELIDQTLQKLQVAIGGIPGVLAEDASWCREMRDENLAANPGKPKYETYLAFTSLRSLEELKDTLASKTLFKTYDNTTKLVNLLVDGQQATKVLSYSKAVKPIMHKLPHMGLTDSGTLVQMYLKDKKYDFAQPEGQKKTNICVVLAPV